MYYMAYTLQDTTLQDPLGGGNAMLCRALMIAAWHMRRLENRDTVIKSQESRIAQNYPKHNKNYPKADC